jgi:hypothetical protein
VEGEQPCGLWRSDRLAINRHTFEICQKGCRRIDWFAINGDPPVSDHPFDLATAGNSRTRKQLGNAVTIWAACGGGRSLWHIPAGYALN